MSETTLNEAQYERIMEALDTLVAAVNDLQHTVVLLGEASGVWRVTSPPKEVPNE